MRLLLFDIDLTLINTGGAGRRAMTMAFEEQFSIKNGLQLVNFAGRTDPRIFKDALAHKSITWTTDKENLFKLAYFEHLKQEIERPHAQKSILPGIMEILNRLVHREDLLLGLLTGNWQRGAMIKLGYFDLQSYFQLGAFSDDSEDREALPEIAVKKAHAKTGEWLAPAQVFVIGDTPLDVACAKPLGAKSVAVATGMFHRDELEKTNPDYLFESFSDYQAFLRIFDGKG